MHEELRGNYRPRYETRALLTREYFNEARLNEAMDKLARAPQQLALLTLYLDMSGASAALTLKNHALLRPVAKSALMHESKAGESAWAGLLEKGILAARQEEVTRLAGHKGGRMPLHSLSPAQQQAISGINTAFSTKNVCLLHGVTSCGKTEIYIHLIAEAISNGKSVLYMLPEIALTTQITQRLRLFFGNDMESVSIQSSPTANEWRYGKNNSHPNPYKLIVGVRSSLFLPMKNLGLVMSTTKNTSRRTNKKNPAPRYNARDAAIMLAGMCGAKTLLGTATPSLESYANARAGKYGLVEINERFGQVCLPEIHVEDVKELRRKKMMTTPLAPQLISEIQAALDDGQQTILFQNRRGYSPFLECHACGWVPALRTLRREPYLSPRHKQPGLPLLRRGSPCAPNAAPPAKAHSSTAPRLRHREDRGHRARAFPKSACGTARPRHNTLAFRLRQDSVSLPRRKNRHTHRNANGIERLGLRPRARGGSARRRRGHERTRFPQLRTGIPDDVASGRPGRTARHARHGNTPDTPPRNGAYSPSCRQRLHRHVRNANPGT